VLLVVIDFIPLIKSSQLGAMISPGESMAGTVQQEVGHVMRPAEGKTGAVVNDFHDLHSPILHVQYRHRNNVYESLGMR